MLSEMELMQMTPEMKVKDILDKKKGLVCREFEKVCPTEASFKRMLKEMHNIFDDIEKVMIEVIK